MPPKKPAAFKPQQALDSIPPTLPELLPCAGCYDWVTDGGISPEYGLGAFKLMAGQITLCWGRAKLHDVRTPRRETD